MRAVVSTPIVVRDASQARGQDLAPIEPGVYDLEEIPNPRGYEMPWLVLPGTQIGMARAAWFDRQNEVTLRNW